MPVYYPGCSSIFASFLCFYGYSALVHSEGTLELGKVSWADPSLIWKMEDVPCASLDTAAVPGLWLKRPVGLACFPRAALA